MRDAKLALRNVEIGFLIQLPIPRNNHAHVILNYPHSRFQSPTNQIFDEKEINPCLVMTQIYI